jgi:hypothetical protein
VVGFADPRVGRPSGRDWRYGCLIHPLTRARDVFAARSLRWPVGSSPSGPGRRPPPLRRSAPRGSDQARGTSPLATRSRLASWSHPCSPSRLREAVHLPGLPGAARLCAPPPGRERSVPGGDLVEPDRCLGREQRLPRRARRRLRRVRASLRPLRWQPLHGGPPDAARGDGVVRVTRATLARGCSRWRLSARSGDEAGVGGDEQPPQNPSANLASAAIIYGCGRDRPYRARGAVPRDRSGSLTLHRGNLECPSLATAASTQVTTSISPVRSTCCQRKPSPRTALMAD